MTDRAAYEAQGEACPLSPLCQLVADHGGECDPRGERERFASLFRHLDEVEASGGSVGDEAVHGMIEASAALHMAHARAGGRVP